MFDFNKKEQPGGLASPEQGEGGPEIRMVGSVSPEAKEWAKKRISDYFGEKHLDDIPEKSKAELKKQEYIKTPEELFLIDFANKIINEFMEKAGVKSYNVPAKNLHIVPPELYHKIYGDNTASGSAATIKKQQMVIFDANYCRENLLLFADDSFHELNHLKNYYAIEVQRDKEKDFFDFRKGLTVQSAEKTDTKTGRWHEHFTGLEEAAIVFQEKKYLEKMLNLPLFKKEKEWLESPDAIRLKNKIAKKNKIPPEEIFWLNEKESYSLRPYPFHYKVMELLSTEIQKQFPQKFETADDAALEFTKSSFSGHIAELAKLVKKTFGEGSFEVLGMMTPEPNSAIQMLEYLQRARLRQLKKQKQAS